MLGVLWLGWPDAIVGGAAVDCEPFMKITSLKVKNIGPVADATIEVNKPLLIFYGEIRQGKTTLLNAVRWVCGGAFPSDIIKHGEKEASIELGFDGGCITRSWYRTKSAEGKPSEVKARSVQFVRAGKPVDSPVAELKRLLNPFLLDQDFLRNKTETERKQYFVETFAVDTSALDTEAFNVSKAASDLRAKLSGYGEIDLTPVEEFDARPLRETLAKTRSDHQAQVNDLNRQNDAIREHNRLWQQKTDQIKARDEEITRLRAALNKAEEELEQLHSWREKNPEKKLLVLPNAPDTSELESKLQNAAAQNVKAEQYKKNLERDRQRQADETQLKSLEERGRQIKREKIAALSKVGETCGVPGLTFDEDGTFCFEGTQAGMLSTSQIMRLSSALSALYPEGLGIELLDRGESLGRSIFDYVKHAEAKKVSVLATVVGQRPSEVPENVGVFVVRDGVVLKDEQEAK